MSSFRRLFIAVLTAVLLVAGAAAAAGAPGTLRVLQVSPALGQKVTITGPAGDQYYVEPGRALVRVTPATAAVFEASAWCVLPRRGINTGVDYQVDLQSADDTPALQTPRMQEAAWLMTQADALLAAAANPGREAAAIQVAIWQLVGQAADTASVTTDAALNTRIAQVRALAAGKVIATTISLSGPTPALTPGAPAQVTVTGTPGARVTLQLTGPGQLSATQVTLGSDGTARVTVTPTGVGTIQVAASAEGGVLWRAVHPSSRPAQDMAFVVPRTVRANLTLTVASAPTPGQPVTPTVPTVPVVTPTPTPTPTVAQAAKLGLVKRAPASVLTGLSIPYTLTVTNVSSQTARNVVVRDVLPRGTFLPKVPSRARLSNGTVVWQLGDMAPRATVTLRVRLRTLPAAAPTVTNLARASASNAATVRARAVTRIRPLPARAQPAVTG